MLRINIWKNTLFGSKWWVEGHGTHLPSKHIKNTHLHVEWISQKTNWKLTLNLLYNQSSRKDSHVTEQDRKKGIGMSLAPLGGSCERGKVHIGGPLSLNSPFLHRGLLGQRDGQEGHELYLQGVHVYQLLYMYQLLLHATSHPQTGTEQGF